jgi:hypothetical protein
MMDLRCRRWCAVRTFPAFVEDSETEIGACSAAICFSGAECAEALPMIPVCPRESASREEQMPGKMLAAQTRSGPTQRLRCVR